MGKGFVDISVPEELFNRIKRVAGSTKFESIDAFVAYLLKEAVSQMETKQQDFFTKEEEKKAKKKLKGLGYLD